MTKRRIRRAQDEKGLDQVDQLTPNILFTIMPTLTTHHELLVMAQQVMTERETPMRLIVDQSNILQCRVSSIKYAFFFCSGMLSHFPQTILEFLSKVLLINPTGENSNQIPVSSTARLQTIKSLWRKPAYYSELQLERL